MKWCDLWTTSGGRGLSSGRQQARWLWLWLWLLVVSWALLPLLLDLRPDWRHTVLASLRQSHPFPACGVDGPAGLWDVLAGISVSGRLSLTCSMVMLFLGERQSKCLGFPFPSHFQIESLNLFPPYCWLLSAGREELSLPCGHV